MTPSDDLLVRASVWLALLGYLAGALHACAPGRGFLQPRALRLAWTLGCVAMVVHTIRAFDQHYGWSHGVALDETARRTAELTGWASGVGLYANYLFVLVWIVDAAWWWRGLETYDRRSPLVAGALHGFLFFMVFNGTVVFASGPARWIGVGITMLLAGALLVSRPRGGVGEP